MAKAEKYVYLFGGKKTDGNSSMKNLLGGKGANLAEMAAIGLPVPAGFTLTTEVCTYYYDNKRTYPASLQKQIEEGVRHLLRAMVAGLHDVGAECLARSGDHLLVGLGA